MATWQYELAEPPEEPRARELWLEHAAGFIIFENVRHYALEQIDPSVSDEQRAAVQNGIDDAVYGLMMLIDGVTGGVSNSSQTVSLDFIARLAKRGDGPDGEVVAEVDLSSGDGMCMGYHGWREGDFGVDPIAFRPPIRPERDSP